MLTAIDLMLLSLSSLMIVVTHSYRTALPAFLAVSVVVATCASRSTAYTGKNA